MIFAAQKILWGPNFIQPFNGFWAFLMHIYSKIKTCILCQKAHTTGDKHYGSKIM